MSTRPLNTPLTGSEKIRRLSCHRAKSLRSSKAIESSLLSLLHAWRTETAWRPSPDIDPTIWATAERNGLGGLWWKKCAPSPPDCSAAAEQHYYSNLLAHQRCLKTCHALVNASRELSIPMAFFKGPILAEEAYQDAGLRPYTDLDVLVPSREAAWRLVESCQFSCTEEEDENGFGTRMTEPGRLHAFHDGWQVEFCYPLDGPCDPMFDLLNRFPERIFQVPETDGDLPSPEPELHLLLLLQHMARHLCCRTLWFLDIAAFIRAHQSTLDWSFIESTLKLIGCYEISAGIFSFCNSYIGAPLPEFSPCRPSWNTSAQRSLTSPRHMSGELQTMGDAAWSSVRSKRLAFARYFLIADSQKDSPYRGKAASRWVIARFVHGMRWKWHPVFLAFSPLVSLAGRLAAKPFIECFFLKPTEKCAPHVEPSMGSEGDSTSAL